MTEELRRIQKEAADQDIWVRPFDTAEGGYLAAAGSNDALEEVFDKHGHQVFIDDLQLDDLDGISEPGHGASPEEACRNAVNNWKARHGIPKPRPQFAFGALPPPEMAWQIGKTVATVSFVATAERFLATGPDKLVADQLRAYIGKLRAGQESLTDRLTIEQYLKRN